MVIVRWFLILSFVLGFITRLQCRNVRQGELMRGKLWWKMLVEVGVGILIIEEKREAQVYMRILCVILICSEVKWCIICIEIFWFANLKFAIWEKRVFRGLLRILWSWFRVLRLAIWEVQLGLQYRTSCFESPRFGRPVRPSASISLSCASRYFSLVLPLSFILISLLNPLIPINFIYFFVFILIYFTYFHFFFLCFQ